MYLCDKRPRLQVRPRNASRARLLCPLLLALGCAALMPLQADGFEPNTLRIGPVEIHPAFFTEVTYNSNISLTSDKVSDVIFKQVPSISLEWGRMHVPTRLPRVGSPHGIPRELLLDLYLLRIRQMGDRDFAGRGKQEIPIGRPLESAVLSSMKVRKYGLYLKYEPMFINLVDNPQFDSVEQDLFFAGDLRIPSGLYLRVDNQFRTSNSINNFRYEVADFNRALRAQGVGYAVNQAAVTLGYNFYADYLAFVTYSNYFFFLDDFDFTGLVEEAGLPGFVELELEGIDSNRAGFDVHSVGFFLSKPFNRKTVLTAGYSIGFVRGNLDEFGLQGSFLDDRVPFSIRVDSDPRNATFHEVRLRFQRILTARKYVFGLGVPKTTLEGTFSYQMRTYEGARLELSALDSPPEIIPLQLNDFNEFFVELQLNSQLTSRTSLFLEFSRYPREEIGGSGDVSFNYLFAGSLTHRLRTKWYAGIRGSFRIRQSNFENAVEPTSYQYRAGANVSYNLQSWLKASMVYQFLARNGDLSYNDFTGQRIRLRIMATF